MFQNLANFAQKTLDLGIGLVSLAADKALEQLNRLRAQSQGLRSELVEELVKRGQMSREQALNYVSTLLNQAAKPAATDPESSAATSPRSIRIDDDEADSDTDAKTGGAIELTEAAELRQQILRMQAELDRLRKQSSL
jgi:polyhydroxyalkanoate synthesis regulator phasin